MKDNTELQSKVFNLEQELMKYKNDLSSNYSNMSILKETESRVNSKAIYVNQLG